MFPHSFLSVYYRYVIVVAVAAVFVVVVLPSNLLLDLRISHEQHLPVRNPGDAKSGVLLINTTQAALVRAFVASEWLALLSGEKIITT